MPTIAVELPAWASRAFPADPIRIGPLIFMRASIAGQQIEDARLIERLTAKAAALAGEPQL